MTARAFFDSLPPAETPKVTLEFRPFLRIGEKVLKAIGLAGVVVGLAGFAVAGKHTAQDGAVWASFMVLPVILWLEGHFLYRPLASRKVHVLDSGLRVETLGKGVDIPFAEIAKLRIVQIGNAGGLLKLQAQGGAKFNLPISLMRSDLLVEALGAARPDLFPDTTKFLRYRRTAIIADHAFERAKDLAAAWKTELARILVAVLPVVAFHPRSLGLAEGASLVSAGVWLICFSVSDFIITRRERKFLTESPAYGPRNFEFEARVFGIARWVHLGIMLSAAALLWGAHFLLK